MKQARRLRAACGLWPPVATSIDGVLIAYHMAYGPDANDGQNYDVQHTFYVRRRGSFTTHGTLSPAQATAAPGASPTAAQSPPPRFSRRGIRGESCGYLIRVPACNSFGDNGSKGTLPTIAWPNSLGQGNPLKGVRPVSCPMPRW